MKSQPIIYLVSFGFGIGFSLIGNYQTSLNFISNLGEGGERGACSKWVLNWGGCLFNFPSRGLTRSFFSVHHWHINNNIQSETMYKYNTTWWNLYILYRLFTRPKNFGRGGDAYLRGRGVLILNFDR